MMWPDFTPLPIDPPPPPPVPPLVYDFSARDLLCQIAGWASYRNWHQVLRLVEVVRTAAPAPCGAVAYAAYAACWQELARARVEAENGNQPQCIVHLQSAIPC